MPAKDWVLVVGIGVIILLAVASVLDEPGGFPDTTEHGQARRKKRASQARLGYAVALLDLLCVVNFLEWRRGLRDIVMSEPWSWVLGSIGLIMLIAASIATLIDFESSRWQARAGEILIYLGYFAAVGGYLTVAFGWSAFFAST